MEGGGIYGLYVGSSCSREQGVHEGCEWFVLLIRLFALQILRYIPIPPTAHVHSFPSNPTSSHAALSPSRSFSYTSMALCLNAAVLSPHRRQNVCVCDHNALLCMPILLRDIPRVRKPTLRHLRRNASTCLEQSRNRIVCCLNINPMPPNICLDCAAL